MSGRLLVLGTRNRKKGVELIDLLSPFGFDLRTLSDFPAAIEINETGQTFAENAALKATLQAQHLGCWVLGEDSGLCVAALQGAPGVFSARFSGPAATDEANNQKLMAELASRTLDERHAHYVCHATLSDPRGVIRAESEGHCHGRILPSPRGTAGFGYDPLFEVIEYHQTFGQLGDTIKSVLSHRSRALRQITPQVIRLAQSGDWPMK